MPIADFRRECREFAQRWIDVQRAEFKRLGVLGDWDDPYTTMAFAAEAGIFRELGKFLLSGRALPRQEVGDVVGGREDRAGRGRGRVPRPHQHHDLGPLSAGQAEPRRSSTGASVVIWTTTPWTIPANRAVAYGADIAYRLIEVGEVADGSPGAAGRPAGGRRRAPGRGRGRPPAS